MLVNLTYSPKSSKHEKQEYRKLIQEYSGGDKEDQEYRKTLKQCMKHKSFKDYFKEYIPQPWEYTPNKLDDFKGVYVVHSGKYICTSGDMIVDWINNMTKQTAINPYDRRSYDSDDVWYFNGLCDNASQAINYYNKMKAEGQFKGNHIIAMFPMGRGEWRWHKWGDYIGEFDHKCEYFCDEEGIEDIWNFQIIKVV